LPKAKSVDGRARLLLPVGTLHRRSEEVLEAPQVFCHDVLGKCLATCACCSLRPWERRGSNLPVASCCVVAVAFGGSSWHSGFLAPAVVDDPTESCRWSNSGWVGSMPRSRRHSCALSLAKEMFARRPCVPTRAVVLVLLSHGHSPEVWPILNSCT